MSLACKTFILWKLFNLFTMFVTQKCMQLSSISKCIPTPHFSTPNNIQICSGLDLSKTEAISQGRCAMLYDLFYGFSQTYVRGQGQRDTEVYATLLKPMYPHTTFDFSTSNNIQICSGLVLSTTAFFSNGMSFKYKHKQTLC